MVRKTLIAVAGASVALAAVPGVQSLSRAAVNVDGTTRVQMTADDPSLDGFFANASISIGGLPSQFNATVTHLWGQYYAIAAHEVESGVSFQNLYTGRDYINNPGSPIGISRIDISPTSDFAIITADTADNTPRDPNSKLVGITVAVTSSSTIYDNLSAQANLDFINQVTGSTITEAQVLAGQSIIAAPEAGDVIWSDGYGAWGTRATGLSNPDGKPGLWQGPEDPAGQLNGTYSDATLYFPTDFRNDATYGFLNGAAASLDSGSPGIVIVPEPGTSELVITALACGVLLRRRRRLI